MRVQEKNDYNNLCATVEDMCNGCVFMCNVEWLEYIIGHCPTKPESDDVLCCILECANGNFNYLAKTKHAPYIEQIKREFKIINVSYGK